MFLRNDQGLELAGGGAARGLGARPFGRATVPAADLARIDRLRGAAAGIDWAPDLGAQIGSRDWWRGLATFTALCGAVWALAPGLPPLVGATPAPLDGTAWEEARGQGIAPLAWGGDTGRRMAANDLVAPLAEAPERPIVDLSATLGEGDDLDHVLMRAGVGRGDARAAAGLVSQAVALGDIRPGTRIALTLGRRPAKTVARPLEKLSLRARFDLALSLDRAGSSLVMTRQPIAIDATPLRIQGLVGSSLYRSARAAGAPARVVESYIKALATRLSIGRDIAAADSFDLIVEQERAATGETRIGDLLFAGIDQGRHRVQLVRWDDDGKLAWFDAKGQSERRGFMGMPVAGRITSSFGYRMHPLLGYLKMHKGLDIAAPYGSPIYAALDGVVQGAGRSGGYGNFVKLIHGGGLASGYGHMSRIAVARGQHVRQGQVIGYVGSTGMSTGPHLHWEVWRNGQTINPRSISFASVAALSGDALRRFKARVAGLLAVKVGAHP
ncbi:murein DD-endopeptidase MepM/ murein hydrolase activator NlpD [Sphingomonas insulae]|uniref:M23ase beta-sheet core domain-containing protein n=1 Tax=Sphingomonas insulae TaxID=424800 RepID=A0ABN1HML3_9SPHN|nr:M23 family metallopeptidase [Sphingomonas insulae]NIJ30039.1 murein DD-endopeptidase MepM/ murein hydrolase activator NlpD [Sphingomonas insulae]